MINFSFEILIVWVEALLENLGDSIQIHFTVANAFVSSVKHNWTHGMMKHYQLDNTTQQPDVS